MNIFYFKLSEIGNLCIYAITQNIHTHTHTLYQFKDESSIQLLRTQMTSMTRKFRMIISSNNLSL
jgi:hypothetical protein